LRASLCGLASISVWALETIVTMRRAYYERMTSMGTDDEALRFEREPGDRRYRAVIGSDEVAFSEVDVIGEKSLLIKHTEVLPEYEGRGIGGKLMTYILSEARSQGRSVIPICPYASAYIKRNPEFLECVREDYRAALRI